MKNIKLILITLILLVSFISCKDKAPETISGDSTGGKTESEYDTIKTSFREQKKDLNENFVKTFDSSEMKVIEKYVYPGGEMEPAEILFLSSGVMVLNSKIFTETMSSTFFNYEFMNEGKLLKIRFVDSKLNFNDYADMENSSSSVFKIDRNDNTIIYHIKNNGFFFFNWGFYKE
jgi:hypothetical protein